MDAQLHYYTGLTLVDITPTGATRNGEELARNQQRNWETVVQATGLVAQPIEVVAPLRVDEVNLEYLNFGQFFQGYHTVWAWVWAVEHEGVYAEQHNPLAKLEYYFEQVPIIMGLEETARFMLPIFYPHGGICNIYFLEGYRDIRNI
jgi:hypothetical protein